MLRSLHLTCLFAFALLTPFLLRTDPVRAQEKVSLEARILDSFVARNIGPANMGGRIVDLAVVDKNPDTYYVAAATGGVWKTTDGGNTWKPLTDHLTCSIGAVAVSQSNPDVVWIGGGEANARNSVTWGDGVYRSTDGGKSWTHMGLKATQHIGRIVIHPTNPDIVYVAALGKLWGANPERGLFKTTDGGKTWDHVLALDADTGCIDVAIDHTEPDLVYAAAYAVRRDAFSGGNPAKQTGPKAGLYKSIDGGKKWEKMTKGLPDGVYGRCGLSIYRKDTNIVYAVVQTGNTAVTVQGGLPNKALDPSVGGVFRSEDKGTSWTQVNTVCPRPFYYGQIRIDPNDDQRIYVLGVAFFTSNNGGKKFASSAPKGVHVDHHALWINPKDSNHLILGNDGGLYTSTNRGAAFYHNRGMPLAQFYGVAVDMRKPYRVYGGLQDNGSWGGPSQTRSEEGITLADWMKIAGADGFQCQCDPTDVNIVYAEAQYGRPQRIDLTTGKGRAIQPKSTKDDPYRFNWNSPMLLSPHNPKTLYFGGNYLFRSDDRGDAWTKISPDLTYGKAGTTYASTGHTLTTIAESPKKAGLIYVGSDDGRVHVTKDGGKEWTDLTAKIPGVPKNRWITRIECSHNAEGTAYLTIGRHRNDDHKPYVFKTTDHGETWTSIISNLPADGPVHVIRESSRNPSLLFVGTEHGLFASLDAGKSWHPFRVGLPVVPIHDLAIHPRDRDLVIGTHGRGVYVVDIAPLEELTPKILADGRYFFLPRLALAYLPVKVEAKSKSYVATNPPVGATLHYYLTAQAKSVTIAILGEGGKELAKFEGNTSPGLQRAMWNLRAGGAVADLVTPGEYTVQILIDNQRFTQKLRVESAE